MKKSLAALGVAVGLAMVCAGERTISEDLKLTADADWRGEGTVTIAQGVTVDLAGHSLTIDGLDGYGMIVNSHAPAGYQLLESLTATGTQYIDIGMNGQSGIRADADFSVVDANGNYVVLGAEAGKIIPFWVSGGKWWAGHGNNYGGSVAYASETRMKVTSILKNGEQTVIGNGATLVSTTGTGNYNSGTNNLFVFARNSDGTVTSLTSGTLYSMRIWQNATMVRDLHPARRLADNEPGLVDFVTGSFYTNQVSEALIAGAAVAASSAVGEATLSFSTTPATYSSCRVAIGNDIRINRRLVLPDSELTPGDRLISWSAIPEDADSFSFENAPAGVEPVITTIGLYYGLGTNSTYSCTWKGGDGVFNAYTNWNLGVDGTMTQFRDQMCYLPANPGRTDTFSYDGTVLMELRNSPLWIYGSYAFPDVGGFYASSLALFAGSRITYDPVKFTYRLKLPPRIEAGAKFALPAKYAQYTRGRFLLLTWDTGTLDAATLAAVPMFFDRTSTAAANPKITVEAVGNGGRLWLNLDPVATRMRLNVFMTGDSITQGTDSSWGNWRTLLMKRLEAEGFDAMSKGHWKTDSADICGATMPSNWVWHSGIGSQALITTSGRYGLCDCMENLLNTAGDLDFMLLLIGTNNINHDNSRAEDLYPHWTNLVFRMLAQKPHAKLIVGAVTNQAMWPGKEAQVLAFNAMMSNAVANAVFPAKRVYFADLHTPTPRYDADGNFITGSYLAAGDVHPRWPTEDVMAAVWCEAIQRALTDDPDWRGGEAETNPTTSGAEANVPAAYRDGFQRARVLDVAAHNREQFSTLGGVPYEDYSASTAATQNLSRVGYYLEIRPKNTEFNDYHGLVRYLWVDMDAFGSCTLDAVGVPYAEENVGRATRLHVKSNMPGIADTLPSDDSRTAWLEFTPRNYSATASGLPGAPAKVGPGRDWNDTPYNSGFGYSAMQVHRFTPGAYNPAEVLFAFNGWAANDGGAYDFGMGNLGIQSLSCLDWTFAGNSPSKTPLYAVDAYEVARLEIWTKSFDDDSNPYPPQVSLAAVEFANGVYSFTGAYAEPGTGGSNVTVRLEWSADAAFTTVAGTQALGEHDAATALSGSVSGLDSSATRYFRLAAVNERGVTGTSAVIAMDPNSAEVVRAVWTGAANNGLATDAGNWSCQNAMNRTVANGLPGASTKIGSCTLASNCDWRGIDAEIDGVIDLKGHQLKVASLRGTGTITDSTLPAGYQRLEYIRATGTQYLDSGLASNTEKELYAEADFTVHNANGNYVILGSCGSGTSNNCILMWVSMSKWYMSYFNHLGGTIGYGADAKHHVCSTFRNGFQSCYVDGVLKVSGSTTGTIKLNDRNLYILARNYNGGVNSQALASLYGMKIWRGGELVRDYIPAKRTSDGAAGLYDVVNRTFIGNKGSGTFTTGAVLANGGAPGELQVEVAAGSVVENSTVTLTGHVKLVKEGAGEFIAAKAGQDCFGGVQVKAGVLSFGGTVLKQLFGRNGSEIVVESGAELEFAGSTAAYPYSYVLNGGTLANSVYVGESAGIETLRLTADSFARFDQVYNFRVGTASRATVDLGGYTLTLSGTDRWYNVDVTGGTLRYLAGSICHPKPSTTFVGREVTLDMGGYLLIEGNNMMSVSNYIARSWMTQTTDSGAGTMKVYGALTPMTNQFWGCEMQDGSKIDLSSWRGAWSIKSSMPICATSKDKVTFANNAQVAIDLHGRALWGGERIVSWTTAPANLDTLVFSLSPAMPRVKLMVDEEGLYLYSAPTMIILR